MATVWRTFIGRLRGLRRSRPAAPPAPSPELYTYSEQGASSYDALGIEGTTYKIGFDMAAKLLGDVKGKTMLDFGSGTGRSAQFLLGLGAGYVYGVDHDPNMIAAARAKELPNCEFLEGESAIPLEDSSVDGAISLSVFIEFRTVEQMRAVCAEVARTLKPGAAFVVQSTSPGGFGHSFRNFSYTRPAGGSGSIAICTVTSSAGSLEIEDTYWDEADYRQALVSAGLDVTHIEYPLPDRPQEWTTDERSVAPFVLLRAVKP